jgi:hypothetical protein
MKTLRIAVPAVALLLSPVALSAQEAAQGDGTKSGSKDAVIEGNNSDDPLNQMECRKETVLGSRLASRKRCMTKGQWMAEEQASRQSVERVQASRIKNN